MQAQTGYEFHDCYWHGCPSCYQHRTEQKNIPDCMGVKGKACTFLLNSVEELKKGLGDTFCSIMESMWLLSMSLDKPTSFRVL